MNDKLKSTLDYEPLGCICSGKAVSIGFYIFAGVLIIAGIIVNFAVISSIAVFAIFAFFALLSAYSAFAISKSAWYWGEDKFTVISFPSKPVSFDYSEIDNICSVTEGPAVTILFYMKNGKHYSMSPGQKGAKEFLEYIGKIQQEYNFQCTKINKAWR